jgi:hypothetical protein
MFVTYVLLHVLPAQAQAIVYHVLLITSMMVQIVTNV